MRPAKKRDFVQQRRAKPFVNGENIHSNMNQCLKNNTMKAFHLFCSCLAAALLMPSSAFTQGCLNPPRAPAPTGKELDEAEPRTTLQATPAPAGVDTTSA